jgi:selenocysteine-specific elongation factor
VRRAVVAITKIDLADEDLLLVTTEDVANLLLGTQLAGSPIAPVSAVTGEGIHQLIEHLDLAAGEVASRETSRISYLPIDRVFSMAGFGTVVTGTLHGGTLREKQEVEVLPSGARARIRGLQTHSRSVPIAQSGMRLAVNLAGIRRDALKRGDVLALPDTIQPTSRFDAWIEVLESASHPLSHGIRATIHIGTAACPGVVSVLSADEIEPGHSGWAQIRLSSPLGISPTQRFIVRLPAPARTVAGGVVVDIAPRHRRHDATIPHRLQRMRSTNLDVLVTAVLSGGIPRGIQALCMHTGFDRGAVEVSLRRSVTKGAVLDLGGSYLELDGWKRVCERAQQLLTTHHRENPLHPGMPLEELRARIGAHKDAWNGMARALADQGIVRVTGAYAALPGHEGGPSSRRVEADRILAILNREPLSPPSENQILSEARAGVEVLNALVRAGEVVRLAPGLSLSSEGYARASAMVIALLTTRGGATVAEVRDALGTSRKYVVALLEKLDADRVTWRTGDVRTLAPRKRTTCESR